MAVRFPREGNEFWPLPADYPTLTKDGQRLARVNACMMQETPEDFVTAWAFFRERYLFPPATPVGMFYKHGVLPSPPAHYQTVYDIASATYMAQQAPRSFAKSTLVREVNLLEVLTRPYWEVVLFLATDRHVLEQMEIYKMMIEENERIVDDFGWYWRRTMNVDGLKPKRGKGIWSGHQFKLTTGAMMTGFSIMAASLGKRPHAIRFDDVERDDSMVKEPSEKIEAFKTMLLNRVLPMAEGVCKIAVLGTFLSRRSFLFWLVKGDDPRFVNYWLRRDYAVIQKDGSLLWAEKMGEDWIEHQKAHLGVASFNTSYMGNPGTEQERVFKIHDKLNTYEITDEDGSSAVDPLNSKSTLVAHQLAGYNETDSARIPIAKRIERPFGETVSKMFRFITVDWAPTVTSTSDFSCIQVMGLENSPEFRDTLWSLDLWLDKKRQREIVEAVYKLAIKWQVRIVGVEAYGLQMELFERLKEDLPGMFGFGRVPPAIYPIKFPPHMDKADKIKGLEWRFLQYRLKLPWHLRLSRPYSDLWYQIENFTDDFAYLQKDDAIDTLAMHQAIGKPNRHAQPDIVTEPDDPVELLRKGVLRTADGVPTFSGVDLSRIPISALFEAMDRYRTRRAEASNLVWHPAA